jgi:hypothetical protein
VRDFAIVHGHLPDSLLDDYSALADALEEAEAALRGFDPEDVVVDVDATFGPTTVTLFLSGSKADREAQVAALRQALGEKP